ncbi:GspE/PulE family protein [Deferrisoma sp.]
MSNHSKRLGELLVERGLIRPEDLERALSAQRETGRPLGEVLADQGVLTEQAVRWALAEQMDLPLVHPDPGAIDPEALRRVPAELCRRYGVLPLYEEPGAEGEPGRLVVAAADPSSRTALDDLAARAGMPLKVVAALREEIEACLDRLCGAALPPDTGVREPGVCQGCEEEILSDPTGTELLRKLLGDVVERGQGGLHLRLVDGELRAETLDGRVLFRGGATWHTILLDRLRQLAGLDARSRGVLQRGRFALGADPAETRIFRLSILRGVGGEEAQVRLVQPEGAPRTLEELGFRSSHQRDLRAALARPGLVWVTSPSEEGTASTLFGLLAEVPGRGRTVTIEDEVFYRAPETLQVETLNLTPAGRRQVLAELRHLEFDRIVVDRVGPGALGPLLSLAVRGRWVLAASAEASLAEALADLAARARDLPLFGLRAVVHQRLVPLLCPDCRVACTLGTAEREALTRWLPEGATPFQEGEGCKRCGGRGVVGRRAFFEVLPVDVGVRDALMRVAWGEGRVDDLAARARPSVSEQVTAAVAAGEVSLAELWDVA